MFFPAGVISRLCLTRPPSLVSCVSPCRSWVPLTGQTTSWIITAPGWPNCPSPTRRTGSHTCLCEAVSSLQSHRPAACDTLHNLYFIPHSCQTERGWQQENRHFLCTQKTHFRALALFLNQGFLWWVFTTRPQNVSAPTASRVQTLDSERISSRSHAHTHPSHGKQWLNISVKSTWGRFLREQRRSAGWRIPLVSLGAAHTY